MPAWSGHVSLAARDWCLPPAASRWRGRRGGFSGNAVVRLAAAVGHGQHAAQQERLVYDVEPASVLPLSEYLIIIHIHLLDPFQPSLSFLFHCS
jgi:hypothetical protein